MASPILSRLVWNQSFIGALWARIALGLVLVSPVACGDGAAPSDRAGEGQGAGLAPLTADDASGAPYSQECAGYLDCDDGKVCTVDICSEATGKCDHPVLQNACCTDADCPPTDPCHVGVCDQVTAICSQAPIPGAWCCAANADCPVPESPCEKATCSKGVCHVSQKPGCCTDDSECMDTPCMPGTCDPATHECLLPTSPEGEGIYGCTYHSQCKDLDRCTEDLCMLSCCLHTPIPDCCSHVGEIDGADCEDDNACTTDVCEEDGCAYVPAWSEYAGPPAGCCATVADCEQPAFGLLEIDCVSYRCVSRAPDGGVSSTPPWFPASRL